MEEDLVVNLFTIAAARGFRLRGARSTASSVAGGGARLLETVLREIII